jgi:hypothetical protein
MPGAGVNREHGDGEEQERKSMTDYFQVDENMPGAMLRHAEERKRILRQEAKLAREQFKGKPTQKDPVTGWDVIVDGKEQNDDGDRGD